MVALSQNGYVAGDRSVIWNPTVPGTNITFPGGLRRGACGDLLLYVAQQLHLRVENGADSYGMWGYNYRPIRGFMLPEEDRKTLFASRIPGLDEMIELHPGNRPCCLDNEDVLLAASSLSNHSSGTAMDWHAPRHPLAKVGTWNAGQVQTIHQIINVECEGCVRWGGDYVGRRDEMHFEINKSEAECQRVLNKLRGGPAPAPAPVPGPAPAPVPGPAPAPAPSGPRALSYAPGSPIMSGEDVRQLQLVLNGWYKVVRPAWWALVVDSQYGPACVTAVKWVQTRVGLVADGVVGPATRRVLGL